MSNIIEYKSEREQEILKQGYENGIKFVIMSLGTHPCCYIGVNKNHELAGFHYDDIPLQVHGGLTYSDEGAGEYLPEGYYWYGWDYAHAGDYTGYDTGIIDRSDNKRYTLEDLESDIWDATWQFSKIKSLIEKAINK